MYVFQQSRRRLTPAPNSTLATSWRTVFHSTTASSACACQDFLETDNSVQVNKMQSKCEELSNAWLGRTTHLEISSKTLANEMFESSVGCD